MADDPSLVILPGGRRGRPRASEPSVPISTRLVLHQADAIITLALSERRSVADVTRELLQSALAVRFGRSDLLK